MIIDFFRKISLQTMSVRKKVFFLISIFSLWILAFNFYFWHLKIIGILFFIIYAIANSIYLGKFLRQFLDLEKDNRFIFGLFFLIFLISIAGSIFTVLYKITPFLAYLIFLTISAIIFLLLPPHLIGIDAHGAKEQNHKTNLHIPIRCGGLPASDNFTDKKEEKRIEEKEKIKILPYLLSAICFVVSLWLLFSARTGKFILSPWEVIAPIYLYIFGLFSFIVLWFIFFKRNWRIALLFIILSSFLLRSYLPIVYETGFGGDRLRHLAAEKWLQEGNIYSPSLIGEKIEWSNIGPLKIPAVFIIGNKTSYASQWALTSFLSWLFNTDVFWIDLLLGFILCSFFIPIFLFKIGQFFSLRKTLPLLLAFLPNLFYPFQVYGAITLPNSLGFLFFLFALIFWLEYFTSNKPRTFSGATFGQKGETCLEKVRGKPKLLLFCIILTLLMYFNYVLYFILLFEIGSLIYLFKNFYQSKKFTFYLSALVLGFIFLIPFLDKFSGLSSFVPKIFIHPRLIFYYFINFIKQLLAISSLSPNSGFITQGNLIYTQTVKSLAKTTLFSLFSWIILFSVLIWSFILYGFYNLKKLKEPANKLFLILSISFIITFGNYFIGKYLMKGSILLSKRLDLYLALLMIIFLGWGIEIFLETRLKLITHKTKIFVICLFLALASISVYGAGPELQVVTKNELESAKYLWQEMKDIPGNKCVLANTWPLLALEYASSRHLITGGFPVYQEYAQPERAQLFNNMSLNPSERYMKKALAITGARECYFVTEKRWWNKRDANILKRYQEILGNYKMIGDVYIFKFQN